MGERLNILVVDDDEEILEVFRDYFNDGDTYSVLTASNGAKALEICRKIKVDFCFTDLHMPEIDGVKLVKEIERFDNTIPIIVITGHPCVENVMATLKGGVVDFLPKPFKGHDLEVAIQKALGKRALFTDNLFSKEEKRKKVKLASLNGTLSEKANELNILNLILRNIDWVKNSSELFDLVVKLCTEVTGADKSYFHILDETIGSPVLISSFSRDESGLDPNNHLAMEEVLLKRISAGAPLLVKDGFDLRPSNLCIRSLIVNPLKIREKVFGVLTAVMVEEGARPFTEKDLYYLNFIARRAGFVVENMALYENIYENLFATLYAFVEAIEAKDPYTKQHSSRVAEFAVRIGRQVGVSQEELDLLNFSGHLHDIGKIGIRDSILLKSGPLTDEEYSVIKEHPIIGANIIGHLGLMSEEQRIIRYHHERWDGKGYPDGLSGEEIPFLSRILAVADVYDAMASDRAYRKRIPQEMIIKTIHRNEGKQFDEKIVRAFLKAYETGEMFNKEEVAMLSSPIQHPTRLESSMLDRLCPNTH